MNRKIKPEKNEIKEYYKNQLMMLEAQYGECINDIGYVISNKKFKAKKLLQEISRYKKCLEVLC